MKILNLHRLTIKCTAEYSCGEVDVYCPINPNRDCNVDCMVGFACFGVHAFIVNGYTLNANYSGYYQNQIYRCDAEQQIINGIIDCEGVYADNATVTCTAGEHCEIDCLTEYGCAYHLLDASSASSLNLTCKEYEGCGSSTIRCPTTYNASCIIWCMGEETCPYTMIQVESDEAFYNEFRLLCGDGLDGHWASCNQAQFRVDVVEIDTISLTCGRDGCLDNMRMYVTADKVDQISLSWTGMSEPVLTTNVDELNNVFLECYGCYSTILDFADARNMTMICRDAVCDGDMFKFCTTSP